MYVVSTFSYVRRYEKVETSVDSNNIRNRNLSSSHSVLRGAFSPRFEVPSSPRVVEETTTTTMVDCVDTEHLEESNLPGSARNIPFLEALNLALDAFEQHLLDRQLTLSGQAVFVCSANHGVM